MSEEGKGGEDRSLVTSMLTGGGGGYEEEEGRKRRGKAVSERSDAGDENESSSSFSGEVGLKRFKLQNKAHRFLRICRSAFQKPKDLQSYRRRWRPEQELVRIE